jgi:AraC-like DNA-binding protein
MADGKIFNFSRTSVILNPPRMLHNQFNRIPSLDHCLLIDYSFQWNSALIIPRLPHPRLRQELISLAQIKSIPDSLNQNICNLRATALLLELLSLATESVNAESPDTTTGSQLTKVYSYFQNHFDIIGNLDEVAAMFGLSPDYFRHEFTRKYGISPKKFLLSLRLKHAQKLLLLSSLPQKTIALQCGFDNIRYFNTRFRHYCGMTPGKYRANASKF